MTKYKLIAAILLAAVFFPKAAFSQLETQDQQVKTIEGKVVKIDVESGVLDIKTNSGDMTLNLLAESVLFRITQPMASIEIKIHDPVTVQYVVNPSGQNDVIKLVDHKERIY